jgi:hypothetical protein
VRILSAVPVLCYGLLVGCAAKPTAAPLAPSASAAGSRIVGSTPDISKSPIQSQLNDAVRAAINSGYRATVKQGDTLYCREQTVVGSHLPYETCFSAEQLVLLINNQRYLQDLLRKPYVCAGGFDCNGLHGKN